MTHNWRKQHERSNRLALHTIRWIAQYLGRTPARGVLYPITLYYLLFANSQRLASRNYLKRVLQKEPNWFQVAKHIHYFASTILDRVYLLSGQFDQLEISFPRVNLPLEYANKGRGCILLGSHLGSFEVLRSYATNHRPIPIRILMYEDHNPTIIGILNELNPDAMDCVINLGEQDSFLAVKEAIENGFAVGMLGDRAMDQDKTAQCDLLGDPVILPTAPFVIAAALDVPVILFFGVYLGGNRYEINFELLADHIEIDRENRQQELQRWTQLFAKRLEAKMHEAPYNWFNFFDFWNDERAGK